MTAHAVPNCAGIAATSVSDIPSEILQVTAIDPKVQHLLADGQSHFHLRYKSLRLYLHLANQKQQKDTLHSPGLDDVHVPRHARSSHCCVSYLHSTEETLDPSSVKGRYLPRSTASRLAYVQSAFCIMTDLLLTASPIAIIWNVRIKTWKKVRICILMSLGLIATFCNAIRNYLQPEVTADDFTCELVLF